MPIQSEVEQLIELVAIARGRREGAFAREILGSSELEILRTAYSEVRATVRSIEDPTLQREQILMTAIMELQMEPIQPEAPQFTLRRPPILTMPIVQLQMGRIEPEAIEHIEIIKKTYNEIKAILERQDITNAFQKVQTIIVKQGRDVFFNSYKLLEELIVNEEETENKINQFCTKYEFNQDIIRYLVVKGAEHISLIDNEEELKKIDPGYNADNSQYFDGLLRKFIKSKEQQPDPNLGVVIEVEQIGTQSCFNCCW